MTPEDIGIIATAVIWAGIMAWQQVRIKQLKEELRKQQQKEKAPLLPG